MSKYELFEKPLKDLNMFKLTIVADSNDADYITETARFTRAGFEEIVDELINLKNNYSKEHELKNYPNDFDLPIPFDGWDGNCHTLEEMTVEYIDENGKIWDVRLG